MINCTFDYSHVAAKDQNWSEVGPLTEIFDPRAQWNLNLSTLNVYAVDMVDIVVFTEGLSKIRLG